MGAPSKVRGKFLCVVASMNANHGYEDVVLDAVTGNSEDNKSWSEATPIGRIQLGISNPAAQGFFVAGHEYYFDAVAAERD